MQTKHTAAVAAFTMCSYDPMHARSRSRSMLDSYEANLTKITIFFHLEAWICILIYLEINMQQMIIVRGKIIELILSVICGWLRIKKTTNHWPLTNSLHHFALRNRSHSSKPFNSNLVRFVFKASICMRILFWLVFTNHKPLSQMASYSTLITWE